jgi:predicted phosphodiesterase
MNIALLADIHANLTAFQAVLSDIISLGEVDSYAIIGDLVNYGPRPNEVIQIVKGLDKPLLVNLWGNHEYSIFYDGLNRFSTERGRQALRYTKSVLTDEVKYYLKDKMNHSGYQEYKIDGKRLLFIHGSIDDPYWGTIGLENVNDDRYAKFDYVISGHSHIPHYLEYFFESDNKDYRNRKRTVYINPGSVGQPRNHNPFAQYGLLDTQTGDYEHRCVWYDVSKEQAHYDAGVDVFYKERIRLGI